jgi:hypothetical protein
MKRRAYEPQDLMPRQMSTCTQGCATTKGSKARTPSQVRRLHEAARLELSTVHPKDGTILVQRAIRHHDATSFAQDLASDLDIRIDKSHTGRASIDSQDLTQNGIEKRTMFL